MRIEQEFIARGTEAAGLHRARGHRGVACRGEAFDPRAVRATDAGGGLAGVGDGEFPTVKPPEIYFLRRIGANIT